MRQPPQWVNTAIHTYRMAPAKGQDVSTSSSVPLREAQGWLNSKRPHLPMQSWDPHMTYLHRSATAAAAWTRRGTYSGKPLTAPALHPPASGLLLITTPLPTVPRPFPRLRLCACLGPRPVPNFPILTHSCVLPEACAGAVDTVFPWSGPYVSSLRSRTGRPEKVGWLADIGAHPLPWVSGHAHVSRRRSRRARPPLPWAPRRRHRGRL